MKIKYVYIEKEERATVSLENNFQSILNTFV